MRMNTGATSSVGYILQLYCFNNTPRELFLPNVFNLRKRNKEVIKASKVLG